MQNRRIQVAFVIGAMTMGGTERQLLGILKHLDRDRFQPHLFTFYSHGELVPQVPEDVIQFCDQTDNRNPAKKSLLPGHIQRRLVKSLQAYCSHYNIDIVYDRTYHVSLVTGAACGPSGIPYINTIVSDPYTDFYPTAGPFGVIKYWKLRRIYQRATHVLCVSNGLKQAAAKFYRLPLERFETNYNFIDQDRVEKLELTAARRMNNARFFDSPLGTTSRPLNIIAVGRLHWQKGIDLLLRAVQVLSQQHSLQFCLRIVGDGPDRHRLEKLTTELQLTKNVQFVGSVDDPTIEFENADVYCLPSLGEGMPNSLIEALLAGVPSIATNCPHGPDEITEGGKWAALVPVQDPSSLADALANFANNPEPLRRAAISASRSLLGRFSCQAGIERLQEFLLSTDGARP